MENKSDTGQAEISFPTIPNFCVTPANYLLRPQETHSFVAVFEPKTIGKLDTTQLMLINKLYEVEMRCFGICTSGTSKSRLKQEGPSSSK